MRISIGSVTNEQHAYGRNPTLPRYDRIRSLDQAGRSVGQVTSVKRRGRRIEATINSNSIHEIVVIRYECALPHGASCAGTV